MEFITKIKSYTAFRIQRLKELFKEKRVLFIDRIRNHPYHNPLKVFPVGLPSMALLLMLFLSYFCPEKITLTILISLLGMVFAGLKYKLDQANYHKSLFDERFAIFLTIHDLLITFFQGKDENAQDVTWRYCNNKIQSIKSKSYLLFGNKTYQFIEKFARAIHLAAIYKDRPPGNKRKEEELNKAMEFLNSLVCSNLSKNFPELKIDYY